MGRRGVAPVYMSNGFIGRNPSTENANQGFQKVLLVVGLLVALSVLVLGPLLYPANPIAMATGVATAPRAADLAPFWSDSDFSLAHPKPADAGSDGPVYSYSVIPGGVSSATELRTALRQDPVAAAHYADFHVDSAYVVRLAHERKAHVSYRLGNRIFWTKREITLHEGETLLSDGEHLARTRCGNRLAAIPDGPTSPDEPPVEVINSPVFPKPPASTTDVIPAGPIWSDDSHPVLLAFGGIPAPGLPVPPIPIIPIGPMGPPSRGSSSAPPSTNPPAGPPTTPLPQPPPPSSTGSGPTPPPPPTPPGSPAPPSGPTPPAPPSPPPSGSAPPTGPTPPATPPGPPSSPLPPPPTPPTPTPEPAPLLLLVSGLVGLALLFKARRA